MRERRFGTPAVRALRMLSLAAAIAIGTSGLAHAQYGEVFGTMRPGPGDQQMVRERVQMLLDGPAEPRRLEWRNPRTGNSGSVGLMGESMRGGRQCRQIEYRVLTRSYDRPEIAIIVWCKQPNGRWQILS
jgi:surface antigen